MKWFNASIIFVGSALILTAIIWLYIRQKPESKPEPTNQIELISETDGTTFRLRFTKVNRQRVIDSLENMLDEDDSRINIEIEVDK